MSEIFDLIVRMRPVLEKMNNLLFYIKNTHGKYVYVSSSLLEFTGKTQNEMLYKKSEDVWTEAMKRPDSKPGDDDRLINGECSIIDRVIRIKNAHNEEKFIRVLKTPLYNADEDRVIGIIGVGLDVSGDKGVLFSLFHIFFRRLSKSEKRYFFLRTEGFSRAEIARIMDTTIETIDSYRQRVMKKFIVDENEMVFLEKIYRIFVNEN